MYFTGALLRWVTNSTLTITLAHGVGGGLELGSYLIVSSLLLDHYYYSSTVLKFRTFKNKIYMYLTLPISCWSGDSSKMSESDGKNGEPG